MDRVIEVLQELEKADIPYCLLRNYQFLVGGNIGPDIDLALRKRDEDHATEILSTMGFYRRGSHSKKKHTFYKGYVGDGEIAKLDVSWGGSEYNGLPTVDIDRLISNRHRLNGCWIPSDEDYFVQIVFHGAIKKNNYRESYERDLQNLRTVVDKQEVRDHAAELFGRTGVIAINLALEGNFDQIPDMKWRLVAAHCQHHPHYTPLFIYILIYENNIRSWFKSLRQQVISSPKPMIVVTGPDGSGKSTLTENSVEKFEEMGYDVHLTKLGLTNDSAIVMDIAKHLYNRFTSYNVEETKKVEARGEKKLGDRGGFHKAIIHYLDILIRYRQAKRSNADLIISDRYIHDVGIYDRSGPLNRTFEWFESDSVYPFLLTGDPEILVERSEYTIESLTELVERYESLEFERLDATQQPEQVLEELLQKSLVEDDLIRYL